MRSISDRMERKSPAQKGEGRRRKLVLAKPRGRCTRKSEVGSRGFGMREDEGRGGPKPNIIWKAQRQKQTRRRTRNPQRYACARAADAGAVSAFRTASSKVEATNRTLCTCWAEPLLSQYCTSAPTGPEERRRVKIVANPPEMAHSWRWTGLGCWTGGSRGKGQQSVKGCTTWRVRTCGGCSGDHSRPSRGPRPPCARQRSPAAT